MLSYINLRTSATSKITHINIEKLEQNIESRFALVITIAIFFPTLMTTFFTYYEKDAIQNPIMNLTWFYVAGVYIFSYVLYSALKYLRISKGFHDYLAGILLVGIGCYIMPILGLAGSQNKISTWLEYYEAKSSMTGISIVPIVIFFSIVGYGLWVLFITAKNAYRQLKK